MATPREPRPRRDLAVGLCADCVHADRVTSSRGSVFYRCRLSDVDPRFPRYPPLPVRVCVGHERYGEP